MRAAAVVALPAGKHRILLRGRGASRLYFDEKLLLTTPFPPTDSSGHGSIRAPESYLNLGPDFRFAPPGNRETWTHFESKGGEHLVVLETIVGNFIGNNKRRPELGELVVAVSLEGSESWKLISPCVVLAVKFGAVSLMRRDMMGSKVKGPSPRTATVDRAGPGDSRRPTGAGRRLGDILVLPFDDGESLPNGLARPATLLMRGPDEACAASRPRRKSYRPDKHRLLPPSPAES